jgi:hypothetical protein
MKPEMRPSVLIMKIYLYSPCWQTNYVLVFGNACIKFWQLTVYKLVKACLILNFESSKIILPGIDNSTLMPIMSRMYNVHLKIVNSSTGPPMKGVPISYSSIYGVAIVFPSP